MCQDFLPLKTGIIPHCIHTYHILFIHLLMYLSNLSYFHFLVIENNDAMNIRMHIPFPISCSRKKSRRNPLNGENKDIKWQKYLVGLPWVRGPDLVPFEIGSSLQGEWRGSGEKHPQPDKSPAPQSPGQATCGHPGPWEWTRHPSIKMQKRDTCPPRLKFWLMSFSKAPFPVLKACKL